MKITNRSQLTIDEAAWRDIAERLQIHGADVHERPRPGELTVTIRKAQKPKENERSLFGWHSPGQIVIKPCRRCTSGTIFLTYIHELLHQWLHQNHLEAYDEEWTELFCEGVGRAIFDAFGGVARRERNCERWQIPETLPDVGNNQTFIDLVSKIQISSPRKLRELGQTLSSSFPP